MGGVEEHMTQGEAAPAPVAPARLTRGGLTLLGLAVIGAGTVIGWVLDVVAAVLR